MLITDTTTTRYKIAHNDSSIKQYKYSIAYIVLCMTHIAFEPKGRLGNALFRYFAIIVFIVNNPSFQYTDTEPTYPNIEVDDNYFLHLVRENKMKCLDIGEYNLVMCSFYQFQVIAEYRDQIKQYISQHHHESIYVEPPVFQDIGIGWLMTPPMDTPHYDIVIHIRLEDRFRTGDYIPCEAIIALFDGLTEKFFAGNKVAIVLNKPETNEEHVYLNTVVGWLNNHAIAVTIESNTVHTDFHIMMNASKLICSQSTLSWSAALLSNVVATCYMPNWGGDNAFKRPIENTILYDI